MEKNQQQFNIDFKALAACAPAMSTEETRYYLIGVHVFERDGEIVYEATNGHYLIQVRSDVIQDEMNIQGLNIIIPAFLVKRLSDKSFRKGFAVDGDVLVPCVVDGTRINVEMIDGLINFKLVDGTYPDTSRVIPKGISCKKLDFDVIGFSTQYIGQISKSIKLFTGSANAEFAFSSADNSAPTLITSVGLSNWLAVLMPLRI